ncbi:transglutaminase [Flavobacterium collinsii]|nr:transglutaminase [Flavobacterium collinsii]
MKLTKLLSVLFLLFFVSAITAQEFKLGKVSIAELEQKMHPKDSSAVAAILYDKGISRLEFDQNEGFCMVTDVETRIKIYKKGGYDWANQKVWYYNNTLNEKVLFSDAVTYNLVNGKIEKTKLKTDGVFDEVLSKYTAQKKITMPNVKEGSVIEFRYTIKSSSNFMIREWDFQTSIPVNYSEFKVIYPEYYVFKPRQKGYVFPKIATTTRSKSIVVTSTIVGFMNQTETRKEEVNYIETEITYTAHDFPALKEENYVNNINNYRASIEHELSFVRFPNKPIKEYSTDWNSVVKTIYEYDDFGPELNKTGYFEEDLNKILAGINVTDERMLAILNHVKSNVKWNGVNGYGCDNGVKKTYKEKTGNVADINLMLIAMLRYSGLTVNPVLVSTRSNGIAFFPSRNAFNYVIAAVETPNGYVLLDATDKYSTPNVLPLRALNWIGRLIRNDGTSQEIDLMPKRASSDIVFINYNIDSEGKISGQTRRQCSDYNAMISRENFEKLKEEEYLEKLENNSGRIEVSEYLRTNEKDLLAPIIETYSFKGNNLCEVIGGKIYVNPMLFFTQYKNPFKQEIREYPVDFGFPFLDKYNITIKIPDGFTIETLPKAAVYNMQNNVGSFKFNIVVEENILQLSIIHQINKAIVGSDEYEMLKDYYKGMIAKQTEKIVLKRI